MGVTKHMLYKISQTSKYNDINDGNDIISFLNSSTRAFYNDEPRFLMSSFKNYFKSFLQSALVDIERTIRGTFCCGFSLETVNIEKIKQMYPNICENMFKVKTDNDIKRISNFLSNARNINSHAVVSKKNFAFFYNDFSFLKEQFVANPRIIYVDNDGCLTIAGLIFIIINFLNVKSLSALIRKHRLFAIVITGSWDNVDPSEFVEKVSKVNLEIPIRSVKSETLIDSVLGNFKKIATLTEDGKFSISIGKEGEETFKVSGFIKDNEIYIKSFSLTRTFYKQDFYLKIEEKESFIKLCNQLPEFVLLDYLFEKEITIFSEEAYLNLMLEFDKISKLNHPKYYTDKNIKIIALPNTVADFTYLSTLFDDGVQRILLSLEDYIYGNFIKEKPESYSTLYEALSAVNVPKKTATGLIHIRNWASHGYLLGEYLRINGEAVKIHYKTVVNSLHELVKTFKSTNNNISDYFSILIRESFIEAVVNFKYNQSYMVSKKVIESYPEEDKNEWTMKNNLIEHSMFDVTFLNAIAEEVDCKPMVIKLVLPSRNLPLYFRATPRSVDEIKAFCSKNNMTIKSIEKNGLLHTYLLI